MDLIKEYKRIHVYSVNIGDMANQFIPGTDRTYGFQGFPQGDELTVNFRPLTEKDLPARLTEMEPTARNRRYQSRYLKLNYRVPRDEHKYEWTIYCDHNIRFKSPLPDNSNKLHTLVKEAEDRAIDGAHLAFFPSNRIPKGLPGHSEESSHLYGGFFLARPYCDISRRFLDLWWRKECEHMGSPAIDCINELGISSHVAVLPYNIYDNPWFSVIA